MLLLRLKSRGGFSFEVDDRKNGSKKFQSFISSYEDRVWCLEKIIKITIQSYLPNTLQNIKNNFLHIKPKWIRELKQVLGVEFDLDIVNEVHELFLKILDKQLSNLNFKEPTLTSDFDSEIKQGMVVFKRFANTHQIIKDEKINYRMKSNFQRLANVIITYYKLDVDVFKREVEKLVPKHLGRIWNTSKAELENGGTINFKKEIENLYPV